MTLDEEREYYKNIDYRELDLEQFLVHLEDMVQLHMYYHCKHGFDWKLSELLDELQRRLRNETPFTSSKP